MIASIYELFYICVIYRADIKDNNMNAIMLIHKVAETSQATDPIFFIYVYNN